ncbi:CusF family cation efflux system protein [Trabulsiella guamensis ATCC 49490]|uniref:CusF family cation efflux system protein n=1 Tax=Trabulsiella guamensis ATCC 49490 TaxID=1005994 RepID=A0A085AFH9_9ENTR|nr:cation efflux system protein CusF [Trabulsiella guamensis]KFC08974.1 CusF family cation efflux system protein [Trabulsiella guamensis ATCC 49490]
MRNSMKAVLLATLSVVFSAGLQAAEHQHDNMNMDMTNDSAAEQVVQGTGVVKSIDYDTKKVTIAHEAIPAIGWPAMTMRFTFTDADSYIRNVKPGSHVNFSFVQQGNISLLKSIEETHS